MLPEAELTQRLELAARENRQLRVKLGLDPTTPDIHLGHCVVLQKLRDFQDAGHLAVLIVGDYTARVGDPSGRSKTRPQISGEQIDENARTYMDQAFHILDRERVEIRWNGEWLSKLTPEQMFGLLRRVTVARLLERDDFSKRFAAHEPISMLEMTYPIMQAYDSLMVEADIELGGTDQLYNLLLGRDIQSEYGQRPQLVLTTPLLVGTDGQQKMSKSLGNYVGVTDAPEEMFGKLMSIPDELMPEYYRMAAGLSAEQAEEYVAGIQSGTSHPNHAKRTLARFIVARFHDEQSAAEAEAHFDRLFRERAAPDEITQVSLEVADLNSSGRIYLPQFLVTHLGVPSSSEARRLLSQGGVKVDGEPLQTDTLEYEPERLKGCVVQVGKRRFVRVAR